MGTSTSKATASDVTSAMISVVNSTIANCATSASQSQTITAAGNTGTINLQGASMTETASINLTCAIQAANTTNVQTQLTNILAQAATANGAWLSTTKTTAANNSIIKNSVSAALSNLTEESLTTNINQTQNLSLVNNSGVINAQGYSMSQGAQIVASGIVNAIYNTGITNAVTNNTTQAPTATSSGPLSFLDNISSYAIYIIIFIIVIILLAAGWFFWDKISAFWSNASLPSGLRATYG